MSFNPYDHRIRPPGHVWMLVHERGGLRDPVGRWVHRWVPGVEHKIDPPVVLGAGDSITITHKLGTGA